MTAARSEFDLIARIRARAPRRPDVVLGIGDDAALVQVPAGMQLVVAMDTLNHGVHFPDDTAPADIGWKALAVNLSDLAAMGAQPAWCTLSLSLPDGDPGWIDGFLDGFLELAARHDVALVGGDTTRGPLSICVTAHGFIAPGRVLRRDGANAGDEIWVTGTLGDAAAALALAGQGERIDPALRLRLDRPTPRIDAGLALAGLASACIDVSDGLLADLAHVCAASGVGAQVDIDALPRSTGMESLDVDADLCRQWQAGGGDDYELCFTASPERHDEIVAALSAIALRATRIGTIEAGSGVRACVADGSDWQSSRSGYRHFAD